MSTIVIATVAEKANKALSTTVAAMQKACTDLTHVVQVVEDLTEKAQIKENELQALDAQFKEAVRMHNVDLTIKKMEDSKALMVQLMEQSGLALISQDELGMMSKKLDQAQGDNAGAIAEAEKRVSATFYARVEAEKIKAAAEHQVEIAQTKADLAGALNKNTYLEAQIADLRAQVEADRTARVEIAKAESGRAGVVVNTTGK